MSLHLMRKEYNLFCQMVEDNDQQLSCVANSNAQIAIKVQYPENYDRELRLQLKEVGL